MRILWICSAQIVGGAERVSLQVLERWRARGHTLDALLEHASPVQRLTEAAGLAAALLAGTGCERLFSQMQRGQR